MGRMRLEETMEITARHAEGRLLAGRMGDVGVMLFNHPEKHNAITVEMWQGVAATLDAFAADASIRVVLYAGAGGRAFVSGGDISQFAERRGNAAANEEFSRITGVGRTRLAEFAKPSIACIEGYCLGGGMAIALEADLRVAGPGAQLGIPAARLGIAYGMHQIGRLVALVGPSRARLVLYTGRRFSAALALEMGLVDQVVADPVAESLALAREIAGNAPLSVAASKFTIAQLLKDAPERDLGAVAEFTHRCMDSADYREGRTAFMEKRKPVFTGT